MQRSLLQFDFAEESDPFTLFQISLDNYFEIKLKLAKDHNISFSELEKLPYFEFQILLNKLNKEIDENNKRITQEKDGLVPIFNFDNQSPD